MNKRDIYIKISKKNKITQNITRGVTECFFENLMQNIINNEKILFKNFCSFFTYEKKPIIIKNPKTGLKIKVPKKLGVKFRISKIMKKKFLKISKDIIE